MAEFVIYRRPDFLEEREILEIFREEESAIAEESYHKKIDYDKAISQHEFPFAKMSTNLNGDKAMITLEEYDSDDIYRFAPRNIDRGLLCRNSKYCRTFAAIMMERVVPADYKVFFSICNILGIMPDKITYPCLDAIHEKMEKIVEPGVVLSQEQIEKLLENGYLPYDALDGINITERGEYTVVYML